MGDYRIGDLAKRTGATPATIRYYEEIGLFSRARRQQGEQRRYSDQDVRGLTFIRRCRAMGFSIHQIRGLLAVTKEPGRPCSEARDIAYAHLLELRSRLRDMRRLERSIGQFVADCDASCVGGPGPACCIPIAIGREARARASGDAIS